MREQKESFILTGNMISEFYTTHFTIRRASWSEDESGLASSAEQEVVEFDGHLQQANMELVQHLGLTLAKSYSVWCPTETDVLEGDSITDEDGNVYSVRSKQVNGIGMNKHVELLVELDRVESPGS
jgi:hypothetical protein